MSKVWVTRTWPGAFLTADRIKAQGWEPLIGPLIEISPPRQMPPPPPIGALLVFTSQNGLNAFTNLTDLRDYKVVTVGDATAKQAREAGFSDVISANGTVTDVEALIRKFFHQNQIIHCAGDKVRGSLVDNLTASGMRARRDIYYIQTPVSHYPDIEMNEIGWVLLFSPLGAQTLKAFNPDLSRIKAISISVATDRELTGLNLKDRLIAAKPTQKAMLSLLLEA